MADVALEHDRSARERLAYLPVLLAVCLYVVITIKNAWISDDAFITFRTVENLVDGFGPRWNVAERVQVYTHPLWMLLLAACRVLTERIEFAAILLSIILSAATLVLFVVRGAVAAMPALIGVTVCLLSKAYVDYSTSGLENPLSHLLLVIFAVTLLRTVGDRRTVLPLALVSALLALSRLDLLLLVLPALVVVVIKMRSFRTFAAVLLGFLPLFAWEIFSLCYYGFLVPNTAYAKLITGLPAHELVGQGLVYLLTALQIDPLTPTIIAAGIAIPILTRRSDHAALAIGAALYVAYVIWIGGDFMLGRFLSAPLIVAVVLIGQVRVQAIAGIITLVLVLVAGLLPERSPFTSGELYGYPFNYIDEHGIADERAFCYQDTGLLRLAKGVEIADCKSARAGSATGARGESAVVAAHGVSLGMYAFYAGRDLHVIDPLALTDPLLARLKPNLANGWRIGHFERDIPPGYLDTVASGRNCLRDPALAEYYDRLERITRGPLFDTERWRAIVALNTTQRHLN